MSNLKSTHSYPLHLEEAWKYILRTFGVIEETGVTRFLSCFLGVFSQALRISSHDSILGPRSDIAPYLISYGVEN